MLLLCSTDGSVAGDAALRIGAELADRLHAELAALAAGTRDPSPRLFAAARATGCDVLVLGYAARPRLAARALPGWQRRVVRDVPCPVMLVPEGPALPRDGGVVLGHDVPALPHDAARTAGRLAARLGTPLIVTHVLHARAPGGSPRDRHVARAGTAAEQLVPAASIQEAALVAIAGRGSGRTLLPRRRVASRLQAVGRLPIVLAASPPAG